MESQQTTQTQRNEETLWTEREKELAERYKIKPERVRRFFVFAENWAEETLESEAHYEKLEAAANAEAESGVANEDQESGGDPNLRTIKRWMGRLTYQQRLAAILMLERTKKS